MKTILYRISISVIAVALFVAPAQIAAASGRQLVELGTGGVTGVYYPAGGAICRLVNRETERHGIRCAVLPTAGSSFNIKAVRNGELTLGIAQSDTQFHAYHGTEGFLAKGPYSTLRSLFSLYAEPFTVVARTDSGIRRFSDLKGKRVNIGNPGSGQRATMDVLLKALGWSTADFGAVHQFKPVQQVQALCDNKIDVMVYTVGHPASAIKQVTENCGTRILDVTGPEVDALLRKYGHYQRTVIPGGLYRGADKDIRTFGVVATLIADASLQREVAYNIVRAVFENFDLFKRQHPALRSLIPKDMMLRGLTAPLHPGARKYFHERGWL